MRPARGLPVCLGRFQDSNPAWSGRRGTDEPSRARARSPRLLSAYPWWFATPWTTSPGWVEMNLISPLLTITKSKVSMVVPSGLAGQTVQVAVPVPFLFTK